MLRVLAGPAQRTTLRQVRACAVPVRRALAQAGRADEPAQGLDWMQNKEVCWSCRHVSPPTSMFFCGSCDRIQPPESQDAFELFSLPRSFRLNVRLLERRYKQLQRHVHPDKFAAKSKQEQRFSAAHSARINNAYTLLRRPAERAQYLLEQAGHSSPGELSESINDPALLSEVMEVREALAEQPCVAELRAMRAENDAKMQEAEAQAADAFDAGDLDLAEQLTVRMIYLDRIAAVIAEQMPAE